MSSSHFEKMIGVLIFLFPTMLMTVKNGGGSIFALLILISSIGLFYNRKVVQFNKNEIILFFVIGLYLIIYTHNIWIFEAKMSELDNATRFILLLPFYFFIRKSNINPDSVIYGILIGTLACFIIAVYQHFILEIRADGITNAVPFGGISIILSMMCFAIGMLEQKLRIRLLFFTGFTFGSIAALLSHTRGAWIALISCLLVLIIINPVKWTIKARIIGFSLFLLLIASSYNLPVVQNRIDAAIESYKSYVPMNVSKTNPIGLRLEVWKGSFLAYIGNPLIGIGEGNFKKKMKQLSEDGKIDSKLENSIAHAHNEYLSVALHRGTIGLLSLLLLFFVPLYTFIKAIKNECERDIKQMLLVSGVMLITGAMTVSLSDVFFSHHNETLLFATYIYLIYGLIFSHGQPVA